MTENTFQTEENCLLLLLSESLSGGKPVEKKESSLPDTPDWNKLAVIADRHSVLPLLYEPLADKNRHIPDGIKEKAKASARKTTLQSYHLLFLCRYLTDSLNAAGILTAILKGVGTASYYPTPELRKSGDIDLLLLEPEKLAKACQILESCGCTIKEKQISLHHVVFDTKDGIVLELHTMLAEPFHNNKINIYLQKKMSECKEHIIYTDIMGLTLPILAPGYHAYELLLHMLQHFLRSGFGLKLLCDWTVFWNHKIPQEEKQKYSELVTESGIKGFSDIVTASCCQYLGLRQEKVQWMGSSIGNTEQDTVREFMTDIFAAEEFGESSADRMVILQHAGLLGYIREFMHQTYLNFPKASRCFLCWPILWLLTLARFLRNNRKLRKISSRAVFKSAGQRRRLIARMHLWKV